MLVSHLTPAAPPSYQNAAPWLNFTKCSATFGNLDVFFFILTSTISLVRV